MARYLLTMGDGLTSQAKASSKTYQRGSHLMSMPDVAARTLQRQILSGTYLPGQMLPGQRELSETMGISRASLREALSVLEALGFIRSVPGKGTVVAERPAASASPAAVTGDVFQLRYVMEPAAAALAARRIGIGMVADAMPRLWTIQARFEEALKTSDLTGAASTDVEFRCLIVELSGNPGFAQGMPLPDDAYVAPADAEHRAIAAAICAGDADGASRAMQQHLLSAAARVGVAFLVP